MKRKCFIGAYAHLLSKNGSSPVPSGNDSMGLLMQNHIVHDLYFHDADGRKILQWGIVDTGATDFLMPRSLAQKLGIKMEPTGRVLSIQGIFGSQEAPIYRVTMSTRTRDDGFVTFSHEVTVADVEVMLIGLDFLNRFEWFINSQGLYLLRSRNGSGRHE